MKLVRVLLAEDHALVRAGIRALLAKLDGVDVVAEAEGGAEALRLVEAHRPDVVLMDIAMQDLDGLSATARLAQAFPDTRVIILSMHAHEEYVLRALRAGAAGYVLKDSGPEELGLAIASVARGETYLTPAVSKHVIAEYVRRTGADDDLASRLTPRQREILQYIVQGQTTQEIALALGISVKTVESHRAKLMRRLGIFDIPGLVRYAIRAGLATAED